MVGRAACPVTVVAWETVIVYVLATPEPVKVSVTVSAAWTSDAVTRFVRIVLDEPEPIVT